MVALKIVLGTYLPPYPIDIQATVTNPTCYGYNDAQIAFTITGGTNPDTVTWGSRPNAGYGTNPILGSIPWGNNNNFITNNTIANLSSIKMIRFGLLIQMGVEIH